MDNPNQNVIGVDLSNYQERKDKGLLKVETENGNTFLKIARFDSAHNQIGEDKILLSKNTIAKMRIVRDRKVLELREAIGNLEEQLALAENDNIYELVEADFDSSQEDSKKKPSKKGK